VRNGSLRRTRFPWAAAAETDNIENAAHTAFYDLSILEVEGCSEHNKSKYGRRTLAHTSKQDAQSGNDKSCVLRAHRRASGCLASGFWHRGSDSTTRRAFLRRGITTPPDTQALAAATSSIAGHTCTPSPAFRKES